MFYQRSAGTLINTIDLSASSKSIDPSSASAGEEVTYTISLVNTGTFTATATITDPLPSGLTYLDGSSTVNGCRSNCMMPSRIASHGGAQ